MAYPNTITMKLAASAATGIALAQTRGSAGNLTLNGSLVTGGVATMDVARRITAVSNSASDNTQTLTIVGTNRSNAPITETIALNGVTAVSTQQDFLTVSRETISAALVGNITSGTNSTASSPWFFDNPHDTPFQLTSAGRIISGAVTYTLEYTLDDPNAPVGGYTTYPIFDTIEFGSNTPAFPFPDPTINAYTAANFIVTFNGPVFAHRITVNSGTGTLYYQSIQAGIHQ